MTNKSIVSALALMAILCGLYLRFHGIGDRGLWGSDTVYYTYIARSWSLGDFIYQVGERPPSFRPVLFALYGLAIRIFGDHDAAIKLLNTILDSINVILIFLSCYLLSEKKIWPALAASLFYSLLPFAIHMCRTELAHTMSATMALSSFAFLLLHLTTADRFSSHLFIGLAGVFVGLGALVHEDLILIAAGYSIYLFFDFLISQEKRLVFRGFVARIAVFFATVIAIDFKLIIHSWHILNASSTKKSGGDAPWGFLEYLDRIGRFAWNSMSGVSSTATSCLVTVLFVSLVIFVVLKAFRRDTHWPGLHRTIYLPVVVFFTYLGIYALFFDTFFTRLLLPLFPFGFIPLVAWLSGWFRGCSSQTLSRVSLLSVVLVLTFFNVEQFRERRSVMTAAFFEKWVTFHWPPEFRLTESLREFRVINYDKSWARVIYDEMKDRVTENSKILVAPSIMYPYPGRRLLQAGYYFGDNAIYVIDHKEPLEQLIDGSQIRYLLFTSYRADSRVLKWETHERYLYNRRWSAPEPLILGESYGFRPGQYSLRDEYIFFMDYLEQRKAVPIYATGRYLQTRDRLSFQSDDQSTVIYDLFSGDSIISSSPTEIGR